MKLTQNMRIQLAGAENDNFADELLAIGEGAIPVNPELGEYKIMLSEDFVLKSEDVQDLCTFVFDGFEQNYHDPQWLCSRAILCPTNKAADEINHHMMANFPGEER